MIIRRVGATVALCTMLFLTLGFRQYVSVIQNRVPADVKIESLPMAMGQWQGEDTKGLDLKTRNVLKLNRFVKRNYQHPDTEDLLLYIGYWKKQSGDYQAAKHSPALCLPANGWITQVKPPYQLKIKDADGRERSVVVQRILGESSGRPYLFYYWFFAGESHYSEEWKALIAISFQNFLTGRSDGGIVELSVPLKMELGPKLAEEEADKTVQDFLEKFYPELEKLIKEEG